MKKLRLFIMMLMAAMLPLAVQAQVSLPYEYGFENNDLTAEGWTMVDCDASSSINNVAANSGTYSFRFHWTTNPPQYLISPELNGTDAGVEVAFYYKSNSTTFTETFMVGYSTTTNDIASFTWGEEIEEPNGTWTLYDNNFPAGTKYIAIQCTSNDQFYFYLDDFVFTAVGGCTKPTDLAYNNVTATSVDLSWTAGGSETEWTLEVNGTEMTGITANPYTLTVNPATNYTVKVKANCSATDVSPWSTSVSFTTPCATITVTETSPFMEDFNTLTAGIPNCWDNTDGTTTSSTSKWSYYATGASGACVRFNSYFNSNGNTNMLKTPVLDITQLTNPCVTFNYKNPTGGDFSVFVSTDGGATYPTALATGLTDMTDWSSLTLMLSGLDATDNVVIVFQGTSNYGSGDAYIYLDDVTVGEAPACVAPNGLAANNVTATSADIAWTANNGETEWTIEVNGTEMTGITENPYTLTDLTAATSYTIRVKANCSATDESEWSSEMTFTTACDVIVVTDQEPYSEGFETENLICWNNDIISGSLEWEITEDYAEVGNQSVSFGGTYSSSGSAYLVSPVFDLTQITTEPQLSFYHQQAEYDDWNDTYNEELHVYYRTSPTDTWTLLADYTSNYEEFTLETMILPNPTATYQIAFKGVEHNGYGVQLDEIVVEATPTCPKPTDLTASAITTTSAEIGWTPGGEETEWTVEVDGVDTIVTTNPITLTNLTPATTYTIRVKANCSADDQSQWSNELTFTTACDAITITDQFSEDFSGYTATNYSELGVMPTCWDAIAAATYGPHVYAGSYGPNGSNDNALIFTSGTSSNYGSPNLAVLPEFTNDLQGYTLSFKAKLESSYAPGVLTYGYITGVDQTTFTAIDTVAASTTAQDFEYTLPSIPAGTRLAFCYSNSNSYYCCGIDDVVIAFIEEDTCATPTDVTVENNIVTWTGDAANYNVQVTVAGEVVIDTTVSTTTFTVEGLENNTHASVAVQAVCAEDDLSEWSEAVEFDYIIDGVNNYSISANIYPNPTTGNVTVESDAINADITVFDAFGKLMMTSKVATERTELNFSEFAPGVYMVRIANDTAISTIKVVKK